MPDDTLAALEKASKGLLYPSESDAPFTPFRWKATRGELSAETVAALAGKKGKPPVEEVSVEGFFSPLEETEDAARFKALRRELEKQLKDLKVFRVGKPKVEVYLVGKTKDGDWAGLKTTSVET